MKLFLISCFILFSFSAQALDAIVIVLEAPLLAAPDLQSKVLQTLRKGEHLFVPNSKNEIDDMPDFLSTFDRAGNEAFIPKKYIKIITDDEREVASTIRYKGEDPTDYRLEEPIPKTYPFNDLGYFRASFSITRGNNAEKPYVYDPAIASQDYSMESGARVCVMNKVNFDRFDQYYFGLLASTETITNFFLFKDLSAAQEKKSLLRVGPLITFDAFKNRHYRLSFGGGFTYNIHKSTIGVVGPTGDYEQRLFSGFSFSPLTNLTLQRTNILPYTDLLAGVDLNFYLPHTEKTTDTISFPDLWSKQATDQISSPFKAQVAFFLGVQVKY